MHVSLDEVVGVRIVPGVAYPGRPVGVVQFSFARPSHKVFFDIDFVGRQVSDIAVLTVADCPDGVSGAFGNIVVHAVNELSMRRCAAQKYGQETCSVVVMFSRLSAGGSYKRR